MEGNCSIGMHALTLRYRHLNKPKAHRVFCPCPTSIAALAATPPIQTSLMLRPKSLVRTQSFCTIHRFLRDTCNAEEAAREAGKNDVRD